MTWRSLLTQSEAQRGEMAQKGVELDRESFSCSVCLDLLKEPVTLPCGHSYCLECIQCCWGDENEGKDYSCPQCRQTFPARPVLVKNTMLAVLMEKLRESGIQAAPAHHFNAGSEDVACEVCTGRKLKAFKSCLVCVASFCEQHDQPHYDTAGLKKHKLVARSKKLQEKMCSRPRDHNPNVSRKMTEVEVLLPQPEPTTRAAFLKYCRELTLDPNTVNKWLLLSEGNRKVARMDNNKQPYSQHPDRFTEHFQVLSRESLTGRCYWEVEWSGDIGVAVAYKNISRDDWTESKFGHNDKSWALDCSNSYSFYHNRVGSPLSGPPSSRVGVYLDHTAGILSFFSVSETMTLLHRVQTTFTQPLLAGFWIYYCATGHAEFMKVT